MSKMKQISSKFRIAILAIITILTLFYTKSSAQDVDEINKQIGLYLKEGNVQQAASLYNKIAYIYLTGNNKQLALDNFARVAELNQLMKNYNGEINAYDNIAAIYSEMDNQEKALEYFKKSEEKARLMKSNAKIVGSLNNQGIVLSDMNRPQDAINVYTSALNLAQELNDLKYIRQCYQGLYENYDKVKNTEMSNKYYTLFATFDQKVKEIELKEKEAESKIMVEQALAQKLLKELELNKQSLKLAMTKDSLGIAENMNKQRQMKIDLLNKENEVKYLSIKRQKAELQRTYMIIFFGILALLIILSFMVVVWKQKSKIKHTNDLLEHKNVELAKKNNELDAAYKNLEHQNDLLHTQNIEIEEQRKQIEKKNLQITESIKYARKIQEAILPSQKAIRNNFPESFIFYRPRDIVSGDFYWFARHENKVFISAVDCTGHSVPGAFMSMIGNTLLNEIVNEKREHNPAKILEELHHGVVRTFKQNADDITQDDGMDITICLINVETREVQIASANHTVYIFHGEEPTAIEGDQFLIGTSSIEQEINFTNHKLQLKSGDSLYLYSDGFQDQFGGSDTRGKKFMPHRFREMLINAQSRNMHEQEDYISNVFEEWRGKNRQVDDVLVIGVKLN